MDTIALVMIVKDEERCLGRCLKSVDSLVDKTIIVDTGSQDRTVDIARRSGAEVHTYEWKDDFSDARNYALSFSDADLNLILDADEYIVSADRDSVLRSLNSQDILGDISIRNLYIDDGAECHYTFRATRIIPKGVRYIGNIHEQIDSDLACIPVPISVEHDGYLRSGKKEMRNLPYLLERLQREPDDAYFLYKTAGSYHNLGRDEEALDFFYRFYANVPLGAPYRPMGVVSFLYSLMVTGHDEQIFWIIQHEEDMNGHAPFCFFKGQFYTHMFMSDDDPYTDYVSMAEQSYIQCIEICKKTGTEDIVYKRALYDLAILYETIGDIERSVRYHQEAFRNGHRRGSDRTSLI